MIKTSLALLLLVLSVPAISTAQTFVNADYGYSIEIDDSFELARNDSASYFHAKDSDSIIVIKNWPGLDQDTAREYLLQGYQDARLAIVAVGEAEELTVADGKGLLVDTRGIVERKLMKGVAGAFTGNKGQGIVVVIAATEADWEGLAPKARAAVESIKFIDFKAGPDARDWYYMLSGTRLSLRGTDTDRSKRDDIYFCADGSFQHRKSRSAMRESDSGSSFGFSGRTRTGSWSVADDGDNSRLVLQYNDGRESSALIEDRSGQTFLDGQRYFMMKNNRCR